MPGLPFTEFTTVADVRKPALSVVMPTLNQHRYLPVAVSSVLTQPDIDLELLVIDGGSTDGSLDYLRSVNDPRLKWTTGPDAGQSDAINKGIAAATGDVVGWLNSDDRYADRTLSNVVAAFVDPAVQWVVGRYRVIDDHGNPTRHGVVAYKNRLLDHYRYRRLLWENFVPQPAVFWRRSFTQPLDVSLHYTMDYDLWLRFGRLAQPRILPDLIAEFRVHSASKTGTIDRRQFDEGYAVMRRYADSPIDRAIHRFNVEKIVWAYRAMNLLGR